MAGPPGSLAQESGFIQCIITALHCLCCLLTVLEIRKKSRLSLWQMLDNLPPDFGCPDEDLDVHSRQMQTFSCQIAKSNRARSKVFKIISRNLFQKRTKYINIQKEIGFKQTRHYTRFCGH